MINGDTPTPEENRPVISVVIPCRNEEKYIGGCIESLLEQVNTGFNLEIIIADGESNDDTLTIIRDWQHKILDFGFGFHDGSNIVVARPKKNTIITVVNNPQHYTPFGLNAGIKNATGEYVLIASAHSAFAPDYISVLLRAREALNADIVGGSMQTDLLHKTRKSLAIREVLSCRFGVGNALFRTGVTQPTSVDTVPFGLYKRSLFEEVGYYNDKLIRNHDIELSKRMLAAGKKIYLIPEAHCTYYARETYKALMKNNYRNGLWNLLTVRITRKFSSLSLRHFIPLLFVLGLVLPLMAGIFYTPLLFISAAVAILYLLFVSIISLQLSIKKQLSFFHLVWAFMVLHISYGCGEIVGLCKFKI